MTLDEAETVLYRWRVGNDARDDLVRAALAAGLTKVRVSELTGIARTTIDRIVRATQCAS